MTGWWHWLPSVLFAAGWPPWWTLTVCRRLVMSWEIHWASVAAVLALVDLVMARWPAALVAAANCALGLFLYWRNRRRRGRAKAWLGHKARAARAALVRKQRKVTRPRPVLRPAPGGAR